MKKQTKGTYNVSNLYSDISEDVALNNEYFKVEKNVEKKLNTDNFNIENCNNYKQMYNINMVRSSTLVGSEGFEKWGSMNKTERYQYTIDKNNYIPVDIIKTTEVATYSTKLPIKGLLHTNTNFLNDSIDYFNKNGKSKEFLILFDKDNKNVSETDIKQMLLDEDVLDANLYKEFQDHYKAENTSLLEPSEYAFINAINEFNIPENIVLNDEYFKEEKHVEKTINTDNFSVENCRNYEQKYSIDMKRSLMWDAAINREKWMNMNQFERYEYANNKNNQIPVDKIKTTEIATYSTSLPIKGLLHADTKFLNKSLDYFNENGKSKEFTVLFDKTHKDFSEDKIKEMLLEENVLDNKLYNEFKGEYVKSENNLLEPSEEDFINAINEVNERALVRNQGLER